MKLKKDGIEKKNKGNGTSHTIENLKKGKGGQKMENNKKTKDGRFIVDRYMFGQVEKYYGEVDDSKRKEAKEWIKASEDALSTGDIRNASSALDNSFLFDTKDKATKLKRTELLLLVSNRLEALLELWNIQMVYRHEPQRDERLMIAVLALDLGLYHIAIKFLEGQYDPSRQGEFHYLRGLANHKLKRFYESIQEFSRAITIDPANLKYRVNRAKSFIEIAQYAEALELVGQHQRAMVLKKIVSWLEFKPLSELKCQLGIEISLGFYDSEKQ